MKFYKHILALPVLILSVFLSSCEDNIDYNSQVIGEGEALVEATLEFKPSVTNLGGSRTAGNAIRDINKLSIFIYDKDGKLVDVYNNVSFTNLESTTEKPYDYPTGPNGEDISSDNATAKVKYDFKLPYGKYFMYAVANVDRNFTKEDEDIQEIAGLKAIECTWNPDDISYNSQMFGYFTNDIIRENTAYKEDPAVIVNKPQVALHSWIKRLASKVTIDFDGSGLHQGIVVYIHNVSIRQIPHKCTLGEGNKPAKGEVTPAYFNESVPDAEQVLYCNNKGFTNAKSKYDYSGDKFKKWLEVANGVGPNSSGIVGSDHGTDSPALFFYENMQGVHPDKPKNQQKDEVGTNVGPADNLPDGYTSEDYRDDVDDGTFIEVEAYYTANYSPENGEPPYISNGPIRYRFMLGQNETDNYNAIRNHHYKVTLGFIGYANQPDWHIEYKEESPEIYAPEIYIPYIYNTSVAYPIRFNGNLTALRAEIIENNWAPYDSTQTDEVPPPTVGSTDFSLRTLQFNWYQDVYLNNSGYKDDVRSSLLNLNNSLSSSNNPSSNYLYGRHFTGYYHLKEDGTDDTTDPYYVTPIWAGFLRLQVPAAYANETAIPSLPAIIVYNRNDVGKSEHYWNARALTDFRNYYYGKTVEDADELKAYGTDNGKGNGYKTGTDLSTRVFNIANPKADVTNTGRNAYIVETGTDASGKKYTNVTMNLWTQPKSMCGNSGFSGNNPYEDYNRRAVIRFIATFNVDGVERIVRKDVTVYQAKRLVNPKAVWRSHDKPVDFNVTVMERNVNGAQNEFQPVVSRGEWRARIKAPNDVSFIKLIAGFGARKEGDEIVGKTLSQIRFTINFTGPIGFNESKCAIIEVTYHNNTCVHNIFVRQGYHQPMQITTGGPYWSSYNLFSCDVNTPYETQSGDVTSVLTTNPLSIGAFFKRLNYARAISVSNIERNGDGKVNTAGFGPLQYPGMTDSKYPNLDTYFNLTGRTDRFTWNNISGNVTPTSHWTTSFKVNVKNDNGSTNIRTYRVPTIAEFQALQSADFGIGVMYGDGATAPADATQDAYGFLDANNTQTSSSNGMRGFICYNSTNAHQIFFPIGTSGIGRRTIQIVSNRDQRGTLRYGSTPYNLTAKRNIYNTMRPIPYNMENAPGSIYWAHTATNTADSDRDKIPIAWDMNYFDLNFTSVSAAVVSVNGGTNSSSGTGGDAIPIRLVTDSPN